MPDSNSRVRPRLLIVDQDQFGYLIDTYHMCKYLHDVFDITYVGWDYGLKPVAMEGIRVMHLPRTGGKMLRLARFVAAVRNHIREGAYDLIFVVHFPLCSLLPILSGRRGMIVDLRTGWVRGPGIMNAIINGTMTIETLAYSRVTVISESLRALLHIAKTKSFIFPLGADMPDIPAKTFDRLHLFYVGSLDYRHIDETVKGFDRFCTETECALDPRYDIVGFGAPEEEQRLRDTIASSAHADRILFHGRKPTTELGPFLERNTVGVAFIPLKKHYECQPATKLFEYLLAGMPVIATATYENRRVVTRANGVLIPDTAEGVNYGLHELKNALASYDSASIRQSVANYQWRSIMFDTLLPYLLRAVELDGRQDFRMAMRNETSPVNNLRTSA